ATAAGTLPYFVKDNQKAIDDILQNGRVIYEPLPDDVKERRKEIKRLAYETICQQPLYAPGLKESITVSKKSVKEWLNQPFADVAAKNEALLRLSEILNGSEYMGYGSDIHDTHTKAHLFQTTIGETLCWIIVRAIYNQGLKLHSLTDNSEILKILKKK
ncbi:MAG: hypothetical protein NC548_65860, partial [Lachnospiraceae bacterium]|nr:hypothetical protein [Lachnospiraceae bacterium]